MFVTTMTACVIAVTAEANMAMAGAIGGHGLL
jgi:hypothetical protein